MRPPSHLTAAALITAVVGTACGADQSPAARPPAGDPSPAAKPPADDDRSPAAASPTPEPGDAADGPATPRPAWLGTRHLPVRDDGLGEVQPTPPELRDRRLPPPEHPDLPSPPEDGSFAATIGAVPEDVAARSTWHQACPVTLDELRYLTVTFWGFDERTHTGELLVHRRVAEDVAGVFRRLFAARFPIEELRVIDAPELDAPPTGDGNVSTGFVCRDVTGGGSWSEHASGLAVDVNPFHNPYVRGDAVVPELASAYLDRDAARPGMIRRGDVVTEAFADIGWGWGGDWESATDWMHFSASGR